MARKRKYDVTGLEVHVAEVTRPTISLWCPLIKNGTRDIAFCLFRCKKATIAKCSEYLRIYPQLLTFEVDPKYIEKYGEVTIPVPLSLRRRRKRNVLPTEETDGNNMLGM